MDITRAQRTAVIAALAGVDRRTAERFVKGEQIRSAINRERLADAARRADAMARGDSPASPGSAQQAHA
jgi:hypothetical protein